MDEPTPHETWLAMIVEADQTPGGALAVSMTEAIRHVVRAQPSEPLAALVIRDPRSAVELSAAYLHEWRRREGAPK